MIGSVDVVVRFESGTNFQLFENLDVGAQFKSDADFQNFDNVGVCLKFKSDTGFHGMYFGVHFQASAVSHLT